MDFCVLGELRIYSGADPCKLSRTKPKVVLALLLADTNRLVTREALVDELWGAAPPRSAAANLHTYLSAIRGALGTDGERLTHRGVGYCLAVDDGEVDALRHRRLTTLGREELRRGNVARGAECFSRAAALWRGRPLADLPTTPGTAQWIDCLEEQHRSALRDWTDARLLLGLDEELVAELRTAIAADPLCERQHAQLITALYRAGRPGEALDAYADVRHTLAESLGLEPGPQLRRIHAAIQHRDDADLGAWLFTGER